MRTYLIGLTCAGMFFLSAMFLKDFNSTLNSQNNWRSLKAQTYYALLDAAKFPTSAYVLNDGLDLSEFHGHQSIESLKEFYFDTYAADFSFAEDDVYSIGWTDRHNITRGLLLSRWPKMKSGFFTMNHTGQFQSFDNSIDESLVDILKSRHFQYKLSINQNKGTLTLNDQNIPLHFEMGEAPFKLFIRGGIHNSKLHSVYITMNNGYLWKDDFSYDPFTKYWLAISILFWFVVYLLMIRPTKNKFHLYVFTFISSVLIFLGLVKLVSRDGLYKDLRAAYDAAYNQVVAFPNAAIYPVSENPIIQLVQKKIKSESDPHHNRPIVILSGGSQTWGSGALYPHESLAERLQSKFNEKQKNPAVVLNMAVSGQKISDQFNLFQKLDFKKCDLLIINMVFNDLGYIERYKKWLDQYLAYAKQRCQKVLVTAEPIDPLFPRFFEKPAYDAAADLARVHQADFYNLREYLNEHKNMGFQWTDAIHLSSYGQALWAEGVFNHIQKQKLLNF